MFQDPENIYVSRLELLRHLEMFENPNFGHATDNKLKKPPDDRPRTSGQVKQRFLPEGERGERPSSGQQIRGNGMHKDPRDQRRNSDGYHKVHAEERSSPEVVKGHHGQATEGARGQEPSRRRSGGRVKRIHDSWSSRASSILAVVEEAEVSVKMI
jgi:hypothetical protein